MARISLKEQYDNKDVITQIYDIKDTVEGYDAKIDDASQKAASASTAAAEAKQLAQNAITQTNTFAADIAQAKADATLALTQAEEAQTDADSALSTGEVRTTAAEGTLWMKQVNNAEKTTSIPIANATQAGLMNAQTFTTISQLNARMDALENKQSVVYVTFDSDNPTQSQITAVFTSTAGRAPVKGDIADDIARALIYQYDGNQWIKTRSVAAVWSNTSSGLVKGTPASGAAGTLFAETDGTGSVNGWDALVTRVTNAESVGQTNSQNITLNSQNIAKVQTETSKNTTDIATNTAKIAEVDSAKQVKLKTATVVLTANGWANNVQSVSCAIVTATNIVWVAPADNVEAYGTAGVFASAQAAGTLVFSCKETPTTAFTVSVVTADV